jgi:hypothetical protein
VSRIAGLPASAVHDELLSSVAENRARHDPKAAADLAAGLPDQSTRDRLFHAIAEQWANQDPASAWAWCCRRCPNSETRNGDAGRRAAALGPQFPDGGGRPAHPDDRRSGPGRSRYATA